eukprot:5736624-Pyramimonas_sp.AAC.1
MADGELRSVGGPRAVTAALRDRVLRRMTAWAHLAVQFFWGATVDSPFDLNRLARRVWFEIFTSLRNPGAARIPTNHPKATPGRVAMASRGMQWNRELGMPVENQPEWNHGDAHGP